VQYTRVTELAKSGVQEAQPPAGARGDLARSFSPELGMQGAQPPAGARGVLARSFSTELGMQGAQPLLEREVSSPPLFSLKEGRRPDKIIMREYHRTHIDTHAHKRYNKENISHHSF